MLFLRYWIPVHIESLVLSVDHGISHLVMLCLYLGHSNGLGIDGL